MTASAAKFKVRVRYQLYVEGPEMNLSIAGSRLLKGNLPTLACPDISFASDTLAEAEKQAAALEHYLNKYAEREDKKGNKTK